MVIQSDGNVGIGTTSPATKLGLYGSSSTLGQQFVSSDTKGYAIAFGGTLPAWVDTSSPNARIDSLGNFVFNSGTGGDNYFNYDNRATKSNYFDGVNRFNSQDTSKNSEFSGLVRMLGTGDRLDVSNGTDQDFRINLSAIGATDKVALIGPQTATNLGLMVGSVEKVRIQNNGNVGIGTTSPAALLQVNGNAIFGGSVNPRVSLYNAAAAERGFWYYDNINGLISLGASSGGYGLNFYSNGTEAMRIASTGNVGIGTTSPQGLLHLSKTGTNDIITDDLSQSANNRRWDIANYTTDLRFWALNDANAISKEVMVLKRDGNVGIGTSSPTASLDVWATPGSGVVERLTAGVTNGTKYEFYDYDGTTQRGIVGFGAQFGAANNGEFGLRAINGGDIVFLGNSTERVRITNAGNVGIGTSSPFALFANQGASGGTKALAIFASSTTSNNLTIEADGTIVMNGDATVWEDLRFPATAINPAGAPSAMVFDQTNLGFTASAAGTTTVAVIAQLPHSWKTGSNLHPHFHWEPTDTGAGDVVWNIEYKWTNIEDTEPATWTYSQVIDPADGTAFKHQLVDLPEMDATGKTLSSVISIKISRGGGHTGDTYAADALMKEFDIHYEISQIGLKTELAN